MLQERFRKESDAIFLDAKRSTLQTSNRIPIWVLVALVVLGWNEFLTLMSSPLYLIIALTLCTLAYVIHCLNLEGPLLKFAQHFTSQLILYVRGKLSEWVAHNSLSHRLVTEKSRLTSDKSR